MLGLKRLLQSNYYPTYEVTRSVAYLLIQPVSFARWPLLLCLFPHINFSSFPYWLFADFLNFYEYGHIRKYAHTHNLLS